MQHEFTKEIDFRFHNDRFKIKKTKHLMENRKSSMYVRGEFIDNKRFIEIFKRALINGLTSFRNKGPVVVTLPDYNGRYISLLCELNDKNIITVISIFAEKKYFWKTFIKVKNRINILFDYVIPKMSTSERNNKEFEKVVHHIELNNEDADFRYIMNSINDFIKIS